MVDRSPLAELTSNDIYKMSFSQFKYAETEVVSQKERKIKHPLQCNDINDSKICSSEERVTCVMCNCILNGLSLAERSVHVNRCLDGKIGVKKKAVKVKKSAVVKLFESDDNDIAAIFSPSSSSSILAASAATMRKANVRKIRLNDFDSLPGESTRSGDILDLICVGNAERSAEQNNTFEIFCDFTATDGVIRKKHPPPTERISQILNKNLKKSASRPPDINSSNIVTNSSTDLNGIGNTSAISHPHLNANMTAEELELFHLRLQLGEYSAREADLRVRKSHTLKCIKKVMKKASLIRSKALKENAVKILTERKALLDEELKGGEENGVKNVPRVKASKECLRMLFPNCGGCPDDSDDSGDSRSESNDDVTQCSGGTFFAVENAKNVLENVPNDVLFQNDPGSRFQEWLNESDTLEYAVQSDTSHSATHTALSAEINRKEFTEHSLQNKTNITMEEKMKTKITSEKKKERKKNVKNGKKSLHQDTTRLVHILKRCPLWSYSMQMERGEGLVTGHDLFDNLSLHSPSGIEVVAESNGFTENKIADVKKEVASSCAEMKVVVGDDIFDGGENIRKEGREKEKKAVSEYRIEKNENRNNAEKDLHPGSTLVPNDFSRESDNTVSMPPPVEERSAMENQLSSSLSSSPLRTSTTLLLPDSFECSAPHSHSSKNAAEECSSSTDTALVLNERIEHDCNPLSLLPVPIDSNYSEKENENENKRKNKDENITVSENQGGDRGTSFLEGTTFPVGDNITDLSVHTTTTTCAICPFDEVNDEEHISLPSPLPLSSSSSSFFPSSSHSSSLAMYSADELIEELQNRLAESILCSSTSTPLSTSLSSSLTAFMSLLSSQRECSVLPEPLTSLAEHSSEHSSGQYNVITECVRLTTIAEEEDMRGGAVGWDMLKVGEEGREESESCVLFGCEGGSNGVTVIASPQMCSVQPNSAIVFYENSMKGCVEETEGIIDEDGEGSVKGENEITANEEECVTSMKEKHDVISEQYQRASSASEIERSSSSSIVSQFKLSLALPIPPSPSSSSSSSSSSLSYLTSAAHTRHISSTISAVNNVDDENDEDNKANIEEDGGSVCNEMSQRKENLTSSRLTFNETDGNDGEEDNGTIHGKCGDKKKNGISEITTYNCRVEKFKNNTSNNDEYKDSDSDNITNSTFLNTFDDTFYANEMYDNFENPDNFSRCVLQYRSEKDACGEKEIAGKEIECLVGESKSKELLAYNDFSGNNIRDDENKNEDDEDNNESDHCDSHNDDYCFDNNDGNCQDDNDDDGNDNDEDGIGEIRSSSKCNKNSINFLDLSQKSSDLESVDFLRERSATMKEHSLTHSAERSSQNTSRSRSPFSPSWEPSISVVCIRATSTHEKDNMNMNMTIAVRKESSPFEPESSSIPVERQKQIHTLGRGNRLIEKSNQEEGDGREVAENAVNLKMKNIPNNQVLSLSGTSQDERDSTYERYKANGRAAQSELSSAFRTKPLPSADIPLFPSSYPSYFPPTALPTLPPSSSSSSSSSFSSSSSSSRALPTSNEERSFNEGEHSFNDVDHSFDFEVSEDPVVARNVENIMIPKKKQKNKSEHESEQESDFEAEFGTEKRKIKRKGSIRGKGIVIESKEQSSSNKKRSREGEEKNAEQSIEISSKNNNPNENENAANPYDQTAGQKKIVKPKNAKSVKISEKSISTDSAPSGKRFSDDEFDGPLGIVKNSKIAGKANKISRTGSTTTSSTTSNPIITADIFKCTEEPDFDIYSLTELQKLCGLYGLKKDTKSRLVTIFKSMWRKTQSKNPARSDTTSNSTSSSSNPNPTSTSTSSTSVSNKKKTVGKDIGSSKIPSDTTDESQKRNEKKGKLIGKKTQSSTTGGGNISTNTNSTAKKRKIGTVDDNESAAGAISLDSWVKKNKSGISGPGSDDVEVQVEVEIQCVGFNERVEGDIERLRDDNSNKTNSNTSTSAKSVKAGDKNTSQKSKSKGAIENVNDKEMEIVVVPKETREDVLEFIKADPGLFMSVISFESLDLDSMYKKLLQNGFKITKPRLLEILDAESFFVSCGLEAKEKKKQNKKDNPRHKKKKK